MYENRNIVINRLLQESAEDPSFVVLALIRLLPVLVNENENKNENY